eukprot:jgi/Ulvmu1/487/UM001_0495.1
MQQKEQIDLELKTTQAEKQKVRNELAAYYHVAPANLTSGSCETRAVGELHSSVHGLMPLNVAADTDYDRVNKLWDIM